MSTPSLEKRAVLSSCAFRSLLTAPLTFLTLLMFLNPLRSSVRSLSSIFCPLLTFKPITQTSDTPTFPSGNISHSLPTVHPLLLIHSTTPGSAANPLNIPSAFDRSGNIGSVSTTPNAL